jgi:hypothetical protein
MHPVLADQFSRLVVMAKCQWLKRRNRWVASGCSGYCMAENSSAPKYTNAILPLNRLTITNHHYYHYSHMTILAIKTSRLVEWTFSRQTAHTDKDMDFLYICFVLPALNLGFTKRIKVWKM